MVSAEGRAAPAAQGPAPRLEVRHISKTFGARTVLADLSLTVYPGEMHGIVGQNGSGKSTFAKVLSGYHTPDRGAEVLVDGEPLSLPVSPRELRAAGVSFVHQDLGLVDSISVVENIRIAVMEGRRWTRGIRWKAELAAAAEALDRLGFTRSPMTPVGELSPADRARVAIARAIQDHSPGQGLILFDESTRALPADALDDFYATVRRLLDDGTGVLMIGHRLSEILTHCDRVTILRDGRSVAEGLSTEHLSESDLATQMLGHELHHIDFRGAERPEASGASVFVRGLAGAGIEGQLDLSLGGGEIVGLTGLPGSGFEAVPYLLAGADAAAGEIEVRGRRIDLPTASVASIVREGIVLVPENRPRDGLSMEHTILENISLPWLDRKGRSWNIGRQWQEDEALRAIETLGIVPANPRQLVAKLSGGNAQKVLLGKWLTGEPALLLLHEPTQGVDVKARLDLLAAVHRVAATGTSVIVATTEPEDLVTICDRVVFFAGGRVVDEVAQPFDAPRIVNTVYSTLAKASVV